MKRRIALILVATLLLTLGLAACGTKQPTPTQAPSVTNGGGTKAKEIVAQIGPNPERLEPSLNSAVDGGNMLLFAFDCLLNVDTKGELVPVLPRTESQEDGLTWTLSFARAEMSRRHSSDRRGLRLQ